MNDNQPPYGAAGDPSGTDASSPIQRATVLQGRGDAAGALALCRSMLSADPTNFPALRLASVALQQLGDHAAAVPLLERAIDLEPSRPAIHSNLGVSLHRLGRFEDALRSFDRALSIQPGYVQALLNRGNTLLALQRPQQAIKSYQAAISFEPEVPETWLNLGNAHMQMAQAAEALSCYDRALGLRPGYAHALAYRGNALRLLHRESEALDSFEKVLELSPRHVGALVGAGNSLQRLARPSEALARYDRALQVDPSRTEILNNRGSVLRDLKRYGEASEAFARLGRLHPAFDYVHSNRLHSQLYCCDWSDYEASVKDIRSRVAAGFDVDVPFSFLAISDSPAEQLLCAAAYARRHFALTGDGLWNGPTYSHRRIRLAYLSADFHGHATSYLMAGLFERHDKERFEVFALSFGPRAEDAMRTRLLSAFDHFIEVGEMSDTAVATMMRERGIDIAVDLKGFTTGNRAGILAQRGAPVQVSYLGYPGSMGVPFIDYLLADPTVVPVEEFPHYSEQVVHLPHSYQVNDDQRRIAEKTPTRAESGLPLDGFVFCCFNNNYKLTPTVFDCWMRLLKAVSGSVLWLLEDNPEAVRNLQDEARTRSISPERLVFAPRIPLAEHLARHRLADLFLDTWPCNAHTTASDALWAGLPVLTCPGRSFASRVAASLLRALELEELIAEDLDGFEAIAMRLATSPDALLGIRSRLEQSRARAPLFDTDLSRRHLEQAFIQMVERHRHGERPRSFAVRDGKRVT